MEESRGARRRRGAFAFGCGLSSLGNSARRGGGSDLVSSRLVVRACVAGCPDERRGYNKGRRGWLAESGLVRGRRRTESGALGPSDRLGLAAVWVGWAGGLTLTSPWCRRSRPVEATPRRPWLGFGTTLSAERERAAYSSSRRSGFGGPPGSGAVRGTRPLYF